MSVLNIQKDIQTKRFQKSLKGLHPSYRNAAVKLIKRGIEEGPSFNDITVKQLEDIQVAYSLLGQTTYRRHCLSRAQRLIADGLGKSILPPGPIRDLIKVMDTQIEVIHKLMDSILHHRETNGTPTDG